MPKFSAYMRGEGYKGETGNAAKFERISISTHATTGIEPEVSYTTYGPETAKILEMDFGLVRGEAAGFSTKQNSSIEFISVTSQPQVSISTIASSPNNSKVFDFNFKIPEPLSIQNIEPTVTSDISEGENEITIWYNNGTTTSFIVKNGEQGEPAFIEGSLSSSTLLPSTGNHTGKAYLVGEEGSKRLYVYINNQWIDQGPILGAGFGEPSVTTKTISSLSTAEVKITVDPNSPESAKVFNFDFKIPKGEKGENGDTPVLSFTTSITTLNVNTDPIVNISTLADNSFKLNFGIPVPSMQATATAVNLASGSTASATVTVTDNNLNFTFGIPQGIIGKDGVGVSTLEFLETSQTTGGNIYRMNFAKPESETITFSTNFEAPQGPIGPQGIGFYQKLEFTSTNDENNSWIWINGTETTSTLAIDRTSNEIIPINIYNSSNNNIAATFTLSTATEQFPNGSILYETAEKFDGTLYYIGKAPTPQIEIGSVTTLDGSIATVTTEKNGYNTVLNFGIPTTGTKGDTGNGIASITTFSIDGLTTNYRINFTDNNKTPFDFSVKNGDKGETGTSISSVTFDHEEDNKTYYKMLFSDSTSTFFAVNKGDKGDKGTSISTIEEGLSTSGNKMYTLTFTDTISPFSFEVEKGDQGDGITNISGPTIDGLTKTYTVTYGNNASTASFSVEDGLAATISFSTGVVINNNLQQPTVTIEGTSTNPLLTFNFPQSMIYTTGTTEFSGESLASGTFYFQYEDE